MKSRERQIDDMQGVVIGYCDFMDSIWLGDIIFGNCLDMQRGLRTELDTAKTKQIISSKGFTEGKKLLFTNTNKIAFKICSAEKLFARFSNDSDMLDKVNYTLSDLNDISYIEIETVWKALKKVAIDNLAALAPYYITQQTLNDFQASIDSYKSIKPRTRGAIKVHKEGTREVDDVTRRIQVNFHDYLDLAIVPYMDINLDYYQGYFLRRELVDAAYNKLAVRINIIDNVSHEKLQKVRMRIEGINKVHKSSELGNIFILNLETGTYNLIFEREDYVTFTLTIHHEKGITTDLHIQMEKKA